MDVVGLGDMTVSQLRDEVARGGRFKIYEYCVSVLILTFKRNSSIYFIKSGESDPDEKISLSLLTLLLGWWGLPFGPIYTIAALATNFSGGKDVTEDIMRALDKDYPSPTVNAVPIKSVEDSSNKSEATQQSLAPTSVAQDIVKPKSQKQGGVAKWIGIFVLCVGLVLAGFWLIGQYQLSQVKQQAQVQVAQQTQLQKAVELSVSQTQAAKPLPTTRVRPDLSRELDYYKTLLADVKEMDARREALIDVLNKKAKDYNVVYQRSWQDEYNYALNRYWSQLDQVTARRPPSTLDNPYRMLIDMVAHYKQGMNVYLEHLENGDAGKYNEAQDLKRKAEEYRRQASDSFDKFFSQ